MTGQELANKFAKVARSQLGSSNYKYYNWYGEGTSKSTEWCAIFVSWCANQSTEIGATVLNKIIPKTSGAGFFARTGVANGWGTWITGDKTPKVGDIITYRWSGRNSSVYNNEDKYYSNHVAIVTGVSGDTITTTEGNANGTTETSTVCTKYREVGLQTINGYYRPNWDSVANGKSEVKPKVYLSPSNQDGNNYASDTKTNEMEQCYGIATQCQKYLKLNGIDCKVASKGQSNDTSINESNSWCADVHIPIHTNAGGGSGCLGMVYEKVEPNTILCNDILTELTKVIPSKKNNGIFLYSQMTGNANSQLKELSDTNAIASYIECEFHDKKDYANWIVGHNKEMGIAIAKGICNYFNIKFSESGTESGTTGTGSSDGIDFQLNDKSDGVRTLKGLLNTAYDLGILVNDAGNGDVFTEQTKKAVLELQKKYNLEQDGIAGAKTCEKLKAVTERKAKDIVAELKTIKNVSVKPTTYKNGDWCLGIKSSKALFNILKQLGIITSNCDTKLGFGSGTEKCVKEIQKLISEKETGVMTEYTIEKTRVIILNAINELQSQLGKRV